MLGQTNVPAGLSTHYFHNLALKSDGTIVAWGSNSFGESKVPARTVNLLSVLSPFSAEKFSSCREFHVSDRELNIA